jgi:hypothetical protein
MIFYFWTVYPIRGHHLWISHIKSVNWNDYFWNVQNECPHSSWYWLIEMTDKFWCFQQGPRWKFGTVGYGITGYGVSSPGIQNYKDFCIKINIPKGNYWILRIGLMGSLSRLQKSEFLKLIFSFFHYFWC